MTDAELRSLAANLGIAPQWVDQRGETRQVSPDTLRALLAAIGAPLDGGGVAAGTALADPVAASRFATARIGEPIPLPASLLGSDRLSLIVEGGERRDLDAHRDGDRLILPPLDRPGYHTLETEGGPVTLAVAPPRCPTFGDRLRDGRPLWGLAAQIYSLRSDGDGGIGHFGGVAALGRSIGRLGGDALAISPVHALFGADPERFSPYSPSTRLFLNPTHADPALVLPDSLVREAVVRAGAAEEMAALEALPLIAWQSASVVRDRVQRALFSLLAESGSTSAAEDFAGFVRSASSLLRDHAVFEALHAAEYGRDPGAWDWHGWQPAYRDPRSAEVAAFARENEREVEYRLFQQWLTARSYTAAQQACTEAGMRIGLIADLAIGMDGSGSHAWSRPGDVLEDVSIGAPPDYYAAEGQNWGLTTFSPRGLLASCYAPFIETLRASLRHAGGIRIDHVMGMSRLWLVPKGASAIDGAYLSLPSRDLFRLIALESWRHDAIVIGEDLGTLPDGFRGALEREGIAGMRVLRFERDADSYTPPRNWDATAAAMTTTHDLISTAGWWAGSDIDDGPEAQGQRDARAWDRGVLWASFERAGVASGPRPAPADTLPVVDAAIRYVAASPCQLRLIGLEDALAVEVQPNVPGTTTEKPNWRHRLDGDAGALLDERMVRDRLSPLGTSD